MHGENGIATEKSVDAMINPEEEKEEEDKTCGKVMGKTIG